MNKQRYSFVYNINKIKNLIKLKGLKVGAVCEQVGVGRTFLSDVEHGKCGISEARLKRFADILGTTVAYLCDETDDPEPLEDDELYNEICARIKELNPSERQWLIDTIDRISGKK